MNCCSFKAQVKLIQGLLRFSVFSFIALDYLAHQNLLQIHLIHLVELKELFSESTFSSHSFQYLSSGEQLPIHNEL